LIDQNLCILAGAEVKVWHYSSVLLHYNYSLSIPPDLIIPQLFRPLPFHQPATARIPEETLSHKQVEGSASSAVLLHLDLSGQRLFWTPWKLHRSQNCLDQFIPDASSSFARPKRSDRGEP
jgi:hypothetical protein